MKAITIDPAIEDNAELIPLVHRATEFLEKELGRSAGFVTASWRPGHQQGHPVILLAIEDWAGSVQAALTPDELKNDRQVQDRLLRLWGDLLQDRSHKQLADLGADIQTERRLGGEDAWDTIVNSIDDYVKREGVEPKELRLPLRYATALLKLGPSYWGDFYQRIRESGTRAFDGQQLLGLKVELVRGIDATLEVM